VKHFYLPPPAIFALALSAGIFLSGLFRRYRRLPRFPVRRVRRAYTGDMSLPFISCHPLLCCDCAITFLDGPIQLIRLKGTVRT
jgi:hypothetical protein